MYNLLQRLSGITSFAMSVLMALAVVISVITPLIPSSPTHQVTLHNVQTTSGRLMDPYDKTSKSAEYARLTFDVDADLSSMFNWNTKLLFAYITADYDSPNFDTNRVVIWDRIIRNKRQAKLRLRKHHNKYSFRNYALTFDGIERANLTLHINPVPYLGLMYDKPMLSIPIDIPRAPEPIDKPAKGKRKSSR
ncbi:Signal peptidase complex subunit [Coemansia sp. RSA 989]|nr:signal peptidase 22kDa subunit [Coemansia mojavensis]KAJ1743040.1 Signal peptidase complex subunit [Coemansia sp. RSA 1086]KAJ1751182.1 Signal peptidase complex subunit [Coemansia sp. RSA 1821]KAJ1864270.1 Signal peptidase complex subunit [Coemansia sp. RSA 989]KAJ1871830.1 Signal peptidase complex subunit [Coemansia sp. RSA 990]KAJ2627541.1 Signal peptidase complex subunit [Coemansia sp. RSA 1290]KAJ2653369.1 Signal peptidase complex subunit [Coemansia sp. RSA 1250]KAJ2676299.1 Signal pe